jgi:transcriptional regulator
MYVPSLYKEENIHIIKDFIQEHNFGTIISSINSAVFITHTPFLIEFTKDEKLFLRGHIALANEQAATLLDNSEVTCLFQGPHCYISPSWYVDPNVPTWNYKSVQVKGKLTQLQGEDAKKLMSDIFNFYESKMDKPMTISDIPFEMLNEDMRGIFIFEILATNIEASFKLSQNKDDISYSRIIRELKKQDDYNSMLIAFEMEQELKQRKKTVKA